MALNLSIRVHLFLNLSRARTPPMVPTQRIRPPREAHML